MQVEIKMRCEVYKSVTCEGDDLEQILADPWEYAVDEIETDQVDWRIMSHKVEE